MSSFDITRIISSPALRETGSQVPAKPAPDQPSVNGASQPRDQSRGGVTVETSRFSGLSGASEAPIDGKRVAQIRAALEQGTYPINPAKIADAMIAAKLMLSVGE